LRRISEGGRGQHDCQHDYQARGGSDLMHPLIF
jgi:hypothetical protein